MQQPTFLLDDLSKNIRVIRRFMKRKMRRKLSRGRLFFDHMTAVQKLKTEVELLTSYSTDVIYRLRYDTMEYDYISPSIVRLLGYTPDDIKKVTIRSLIRETRIVTDNMRKVQSFTSLEENRQKRDVQKWQADYLMRTRDGRSIWVSDISYPWFDDEGNIIGSVGTLRDITERTEAEGRVKEELTRLANTDPLTSIANRRAFFERVDMEMKRMRRTGSPLSILLIDIDHFKKLNDQYGHSFGDRVIIEVARIIATCLRETDMVARLGGEEYGVLLPDTDTQGAFWVAERIRGAIAGHNFSEKEESPIGCTVSIGISDVKSDGVQDSTELYKIADTRLYIAKNTGRNQTSMDEIVAMH